MQVRSALTILRRVWGPRQRTAIRVLSFAFLLSCTMFQRKSVASVGGAGATHSFCLYAFQNRYCAFFLRRVQMGVGPQGDLRIGVSEPPGDLLDVYSRVAQQTCVTMAELMDRDVLHARRRRKIRVRIFDGRVRNRGRTAADENIFAPPPRPFLLLFVLFQFLHQYNRHLEPPHGSCVLRRRLHPRSPL